MALEHAVRSSRRSSFPGPLMVSWVCALLGLSVGCRSSDLPDQSRRAGPPDVQPPVQMPAVPPKYVPLIRSCLEQAGANAARIEHALDRSKGFSEEKREALCFLLAYMPVADLARIYWKLLRENVAYAFAARKIFPWGPGVPPEVFRHYVLPHRVSREPLTRWRKRLLFGELYVRFRSMEGAPQATLELNRWVSEKAALAATEPRDQGPLAVLASGKARAEEMALLYVSAARSIGLPARLVRVPYWTRRDGNYAWVELWGAGNWRPLVPGFPSDRSGNHWWNKVLADAPVVFTQVYGVPPESLQKMDASAKSARLYCTDLYRQVCEIEVSALFEGKPQSGVGVYWYVYNRGAMRILRQARTSRQGQARLEVGLGDYLVTASKGRLRAWAAVKADRPGARVKVDLELELNGKPSAQPYTLEYPIPMEGKGNAEESQPQ